MIISIHQPDYIPYPGLFYKMWKSEKFVFLDDAQFSSDNMHHWNRIKTPQGECRLKVPVKHVFGDPICKVETRDNLKWKEKHLKTIEMNYKKSKYLNDFFPTFREILMTKYNTLADMNVTINTCIAEKFGIKPQFFRTSNMEIKTVREERVIDICVILGADEYISGNGAKAYQVESHFTDRGVKLHYTDYQPIKYQQCWGDFIPNLSILDYIFNCGFDWDYVLRDIQTANNKLGE